MSVNIEIYVIQRGNLLEEHDTSSETPHKDSPSSFDIYMYLYIGNLMTTEY